jgi:hypothetical protein
MSCLRCHGNRDNAFKTCNNCLRLVREYKQRNQEHIKQVNRAWVTLHWARRMVSHSRASDKLYNRVASPTDAYIDPGYLHRLRAQQHNRCAWCTDDMQEFNRKRADGLTIQRLDNNKPHIMANCLLACHACNVRRVETGCNDAYVAFKRARLYFERLLKSGYPYATSSRRACLS